MAIKATWMDDESVTEIKGRSGNQLQKTQPTLVQKGREMAFRAEALVNSLTY